MKTKSRCMILAALVLTAMFAFGAMAMVSAENSGTNGWVSDAPEGASTAYGSNLAWPLAPTDKGDGVTEWCFNNGHVVANENALDVTKPIVLTYSAKSNVDATTGGSWVMFALATSFEGATKLTAGIQEEVNAQYRPFFYAHQMKDNRDKDAGGAGATVTVDNGRYAMLENKCGVAYDAGAMTTLEIYFGAEKAEEGYILVDGLYVGYPNVAQSDYADCGKQAYLAISAFNSGFFRMKVENTPNVTDVKDYNISVSSTGPEVVLEDNTLWRADAGETVRFRVSGIPEGYIVKSVRAGDTVLTAENDVYSFSMPASAVTIFVETEKAPDMYSARYTGNSSIVAFESGTDSYAAGATVRFTVMVKEAYSLVAVKVDGEMLTAQGGIYSFIMPDKDVEIEVDVSKNYSKPSDKTVKNAVNGWNSEQGVKDPLYGPVVDANGSSMVDEGKGYSNFALNNAGSISAVVGFDVTKPIYLDLLVMPNGEVPGPLGWFMIGLFDDWDIMLEAGVNGYGTSGTTPDLNEKINEYLKFCFGFDYSDITSTTLPLSSFKNVTMDNGFTLTNKFGDTWNWTEDNRSTDFEYANIELFIGKSAGEGYIKIDGVKVGTPAVKQADFHENTAYVHFMSFYSSRVQAKIYADAQLDTSRVDSRADVTFVEGTDLSNLKTYDVVTFRVDVPENHGALVSIDGKELKPDANGNYTAVIGYGTSVLQISVDEIVTVSFETNGFGSLFDQTVTKGGTLSAPVLEREGYTLAWYADAAYTKAFDFSAAIENSCTVYAKWTPIEYSISYYDGANKIRDLSPASYNTETATFSLPTPVKKGFEFDGWYTSASFEGQKLEKIEKGMTGELTLYAKWREPSAGGCGSIVIASSGIVAALVAVVSVAAFVCRKKTDR